LFSVSPIAYGDFTGLVPLGNLNPSGHTFPTDHLYFYLPTSVAGGPPDITTVRMPGDAWVTQIRALEHLSAVPAFTDYSIHFQPCREYDAYFGHLQTIVPELAAALAGGGVCETRDVGGESFRECKYALNHRIPAGAILGTSGGQMDQFAIDFGAIDLRQAPRQWANQARILGSNTGLPYIACPIDEFEAPVRSVLESRFGSYDGTILRTTAPRCGTIAQDVAGTAQGIWVVEGTTNLYPEDPHVALVHDNINPDLGAFSIGTSFPGRSPVVFQFAPTHAGRDNREFSEVANDGQVYCYGPIGAGSMLIQLETPTRLLAEYRSSVGCSGAPYTIDPAAVVFVR